MSGSIRLEGDTREILEKLRGFTNIDKKRLNGVLAEEVRDSTVERFKLGKAPDGKKWRTSIRAATEGGVTLVDSGQLRNSIKSKSDASGFAVGTNAKHASTHQLGAEGRVIRARRKKTLRFMVNGVWVSKKAVKVNIPPRPFLGLSEGDMKEIQATVEDFISQEV